jgi:hypothetical protein
MEKRPMTNPRDLLEPPTPAEWIEMAKSVLMWTRIAYALGHSDRDRISPLDDADKVQLRDAIQNANNFYLAMARTTGDVLMLMD